MNFWVKSASVFQNNSNVIAYELINEPWAGDVFAVRSRFLLCEQLLRRGY